MEDNGTESLFLLIKHYGNFQYALFVINLILKPVGNDLYFEFKT